MPSKFSTNSTYLSIYTHRKGDMLPNERNELLRQIREMVNYSEAETWADWESLNMPAYYSRKRLETSLPLGTLSNLGVLGLLIRLARVTSRFSKKA
jgi:hypothetical protein